MATSTTPGNKYIYYNDTQGHYNNVNNVYYNNSQLYMILKQRESWSGFSPSYCVGNTIIEGRNKSFSLVYYNPNVFEHMKSIGTGATVTAKYPLTYNSSAMGWFNTTKYTENYVNDSEEALGIAYSYILMSGSIKLTGATTSSLVYIENTASTASTSSQYFTLISNWNGPDIEQVSETASIGAGTRVFLCTVRFKPKTGNSWFDNNSSLYCTFDVYMYMSKYYSSYTDGLHYFVQLNYYYENLTNQWLMGQLDWGIALQEFNLSIQRDCLYFSNHLMWDSHASPNL